MTERRDLEAPDRRCHPLGGRRAADQPHGTRAKYQSGCTCLFCRAAEAGYRASLRARHVKGLPIFGALVSSVEPRRQLRLLLTEYEGAHAALAERVARRRVRLQGQRVRHSTALLIAARYQLDILAGLPDSPG